MAKSKKLYKKRGRPKGSKNKKAIMHRKVAKGIEVYKRPDKKSYVRTVRFLGYCSCKGSIGKTDMRSMTTYECPSCGNIGKIKELIKVRDGIERPTSKKEYFESSYKANYVDNGSRDISIKAIE